GGGRWDAGGPGRTERNGLIKLGAVEIGQNMLYCTKQQKQLIYQSGQNWAETSTREQNKFKKQT
ncbi:MAG TPA: hypothetical protein VGO47_15295, partial [Chlamydiales bacterium]|nr:hypothetical protein [Chlamydiales bacterium]